MAHSDFAPSAPRLSIRATVASLAEVFGRAETGAKPTDLEQRDFVLEVLCENADAFSCERDVQCLMHIYPGRF